LVKEYFTTKNYFYHIKFWYGKNLKVPLRFRCKERDWSIQFNNDKTFNLVHHKYLSRKLAVYKRK